MSHARLTFIGVAAATLFVSGCAGPAWFAHAEFPATGKRRPTPDKETTAATEPSTRSSDSISAALPREPSLSQMLDDIERIKYRNPSDYAVIQSAVEDASSLFPPQLQQTFKDQMLGVALKQQEQAAALRRAPAAAQPVRAPIAVAPVVRSLPLTSPAAQVLPQVSPQRFAAPTSFSIEAAPALLRSNVAAAPTGPLTTDVNGTPSSQPAPETSDRVTATATVEEQEIKPGQWSREIEQALASLSADLARPNLDRDERARLEILRRLLYVATNQRDEAVSPIDQLDEDEREYWKHQIHGLLVSIDADGKHPTTRRAALALRNLRTAVDHLANISTLDVRSLTFCKEVLSYGEYHVFDSYSFRAKDEVVLYVEIENFAAHPRSDSFETELHSSYEIVDDAGRRVANVVLPVDKQVSNNRRRDYFIAYLITMPSQIARGSYRLQLTVEDVIGKKSNHAAIDFRIQ